MNPDILLFLGVLIGAVSFPSLVASFSSDRSPIRALAFFVVGAALILAAASMKPGGYEFNEIPDVMVGVVRDALN